MPVTAQAKVLAVQLHADPHAARVLGGLEFHRNLPKGQSASCSSFYSELRCLVKILSVSVSLSTLYNFILQY